MSKTARVKSSFSVGQGACIELSELSNGEFVLTNSRCAVSAMMCTRKEAVAFVLGAKNGDFDELLGLSVPAETEPLVGVAD